MSFESFSPVGTARIRRLRALAGAVLMAFALTALPHADASAAAAATAPAAVHSKQDAADVARVEKYLNSLRTMTARFLQYAPDGSTAEGTLYLSRPGRLRLEYDPPTPVLIVSDGRLIHYYDSELKQVSTVRLSETPAAVLVRDKYDFSKDIRVVALQRGPGVLRMTLQDVDNPDTGRLTLTFQEDPFVLKQWKVVDAQGQTTTVALSDSRRDVTLAPDLFEFVDPTKPRAPFGN
jgi:outer membrane lipoprotein-sorting protein